MHQRSSSSDGGYFNADSDSLSDEADDAMGVKSSIKQKLSSCYSSCISCFGKPTNNGRSIQASQMANTPNGVNLKPQGLFGSKSFNEVCLEIAENDNFGGLQDKQSFGLISCIVKSGDDLKQEQFAS